MRSAIQKVVEAEEEAKLILKAARDEAEGLLSAARKQARNIVERVRGETGAEAELILAQAEADAVRLKGEQLELAARDLQARIRLDDDARRNAVSATLQFVRGRQRHDAAGSPP